MPGYEERVMKRAHKAAKNMILVIIAFLVQWSASTVYGIWRAANVPMTLPLLQTAMISANIGGILNGIVFAILRHQKRSQNKDESPCSPKPTPLSISVSAP